MDFQQNLHPQSHLTFVESQPQQYKDEVAGDEYAEPATPSKPDASAQPTGMFQCGFCKKCYNRADHLQRHVRSHSGEKPYACNVCMKTFGRPDLLKRHAEGHLNDREDSSKRRKTKYSTQSSRVTQACKACSASKLKCDENKPCHRCRSRGYACEPVHPPNAGPSQSQSPEALMPTIQSQLPPIPPFRVDDQLPTPGSSDRASIASNANDHILESEWGFFPDIFGLEWCPGRPLMVTADHVESAKALPPFTSVSSVGPLSREPYDWNSQTFNPETFRASVQQATDPVESPAEWGSGGDNLHPEETKLALPPALPIKARRKPQSQVLRENMDYTARDRILNLVISNVQRDNVDKIVRSFPATELFDDFMQHFFNDFVKRIDDWIHAGTFRPNHVAVGLLCAVIATGAVYQEQHVLRTIGYAMLEQARAAIPRTIDMHNTVVREMDHQQGYLLQLETRLFSGNKRKVEMAEALFQPGVTMLRRARMFRRSEYLTIAPELLDDKENLEEKWRKWAKQEEKKRTVFHCLIHDVRAGVTLNTPPLIGLHEMSLPFPETEALWRARSAPEWKQVFSQRTGPLPPRLPSLIDALQDLSVLATYADYIDLNFSLFVIIHSLWYLIWQHREARPLQSYIDWRNPGMDSSAYAKCFKILGNLRTVMEQLPPIRPEVWLTYEFFGMTFHSTFEILHFFGPKGDRHEAVRLYHEVRQWVDSPSSRQSIWHAASVLHHMRIMPPNILGDFYTVIAFHAACVLWNYGVIMRSRNAQNQHLQHPQPPILVLDHPATTLRSVDLQAFIYNDPANWYPCIQHHRHELTSLDDPVGLIEEVQYLLAVNWGQGPPEQVKGVRKLISDLGVAAKTMRA